MNKFPESSKQLFKRTISSKQNNMELKPLDAQYVEENNLDPNLSGLLQDRLLRTNTGANSCKSGTKPNSPTHFKSEQSPKNSQNKKQQGQKLKTCSIVCIEGDSHVRHLSGLLRSVLPSGTKVISTCKPGAKLPSVTCGSAPTSECCYILVAGTNDIANNELPSTIYRHLEDQLNSRLSTVRRVIISTIPIRHDLPKHHLFNQRINMTNSLIKDLCAKTSNAQIIEFHMIERRFFHRMACTCT